MGKRAASSIAASIEKLVHWMSVKGTRELTVVPLPQTLLKLRELLGFTHAALASKVGLRESVVRRAEIGMLPLSMEQTARYRQLSWQAGLDWDRLAA